MDCSLHVCRIVHSKFARIEIAPIRLNPSGPSYDSAQRRHTCPRIDLVSLDWSGLLEV